MGKRVCAEPGCPTLVDPTAYRGLCPTHRRQRDQDRGTREQRGYGREHTQERTKIQNLINAGSAVHCHRCGVRLVGHDWHLDHTPDRDGYRGPACATCNLHLAGRARHGLT